MRGVALPTHNRGMTLLVCFPLDVKLTGARWERCRRGRDGGMSKGGGHGLEWERKGRLGVDHDKCSELRVWECSGKASVSKQNVCCSDQSSLTLRK